jgi:hypothetical protein
MGLRVRGRKWFFWFGLGFEMGPFGISCPRAFEALTACWPEGSSNPRSTTWEGLSPKLGESSRGKERGDFRGEWVTRDSRERSVYLSSGTVSEWPNPTTGVTTSI